MNGIVSELRLLELPGRSTDELMLIVQQGDAMAFEELYRRLAPTIKEYLISRSNKSVFVNDVVQEVFCRVWENKGRFVIGKASAKTYVLRVARNVYFEFSREIYRNIRLASAYAVKANAEIEEDDTLDTSVAAQALCHARSILTNKQLTAISLVYDKGVKPREAAQRLNCTEKAFRRRLEEGRRKLYSHLRAQVQPTQPGEAKTFWRLNGLLSCLNTQTKYQRKRLRMLLRDSSR